MQMLTTQTSVHVGIDLTIYKVLASSTIAVRIFVVTSDERIPPPQFWVVFIRLNLAKSFDKAGASFLPTSDLLLEPVRGDITNGSLNIDCTGWWRGEIWDFYERIENVYIIRLTKYSHTIWKIRNHLFMNKLINDNKTPCPPKKKRNDLTDSMSIPEQNTRDLLHFNKTTSSTGDGRVRLHEIPSWKTNQKFRDVDQSFYCGKKTLVSIGLNTSTIDSGL